MFRPGHRWQGMTESPKSGVFVGKVEFQLRALALTLNLPTTPAS